MLVPPGWSPCRSCLKFKCFAIGNAFGVSSGAFLVASKLAPPMSASKESMLCVVTYHKFGHPAESLPTEHLPTETRATAAVKALQTNDMPSKLIGSALLKVDKDILRVTLVMMPSGLDAFGQSGLLKNGLLTQDPRTSEGWPQIASLAPEDDYLVVAKSRISSCLIVA